MKRFLLTALLSLTTFLGASEEDVPDTLPLSELQGEPSAFVEGSVNVITGNWCDHQVDYVIQGPRPLTLERYYNSGVSASSAPLKRGWTINHHGKIAYEDALKSDNYIANLEDSFGSELHFFRLKKGKEYDDKGYPILSLCHCLLRKGVTNLGSGCLSARTNIKNNNVHFSYSKGFLERSDGSTTYFHKSSSSKKHHFMTKHTFLDGSEIDYSYEYRRYFRDIASKGPTGDLWGQLHFNHLDSDKFKKKKYFTVDGSDGGEVVYRFYGQKWRTQTFDSFFLNEVESPLHPTQKYFYKKHSHQILRKEEPDHHFQEICYYEPKTNHVGSRRVTIQSDNDPRINRVMMLKGPVGVDETPIITQRFFYDIRTQKKKNGQKKPLGGSADVFDALDHKTVYRFSDQYQLTDIEKYRDDGSLYCVEKMVWGGKNTSDESNLVKRQLLDGKGSPYFTREYVYDKKGNVIEEVISGNLTGRGGCDRYVKTFEYNNYHLVVSEDDGFKKTTYTYVPGTDWIQSKMVLSDGQIKFREFYSYDHNGVLIEKIIDDGVNQNPKSLVGVTERKMTRIKPTQKAPYGLPKVIDDLYFDMKSHQEKLLTRRINSYSKEGRRIQEELLDSQGQVISTRFWEYDSRGNVTKEINPLGNVIIRDYDLNGNKVFEQGPDCSLKKYYTYDYADRLVKEEEKSADGASCVVSHRYDYLGNRVATVDRFGHETSYVYDEFGRLVQTVKPALISEKGLFYHPMEFCDYDLMGNVTLSIDGNGNTTQQKYTIFQKPYEVIHPDGTVEKTFYNLDGTVAQTIDPAGVSTFFTYDYQQRVIREEKFSFQGDLLSERSWNYNAFHLLSEKDPEGHQTFYEHDGAGRVISKKSGVATTQYTYDSLGRKAELIEWYDENAFRKTITTYDVLDRVIEERVESSDGEVLSRQSFKYDASGHRVAVHTHGSKGLSSVFSEYNAFGELIRNIHPDGSEIIRVYRDDYWNEDGVQVGCIEEIDQNGILTRQVLDTNQQLQKEEVIDSLGQVVKCTRIFRDGVGNSICQKDDVIANNQVLRTHCMRFAYDARNREVMITEEGKVTRREYTFFGEISKVIKPDGTMICQTYDPLRRLSEVYDSDHRIHYCYTYDLNDHIIQVDDCITHRSTKRVFNPNGHLIEETLENGLTSAYSHDHLGRLKEVILPDHSTIHYDHGPLFLDHVTRRSYTHSYTYDLSGKVIRSDTPLKNGVIDYTYDNSFRPTTIRSSYWTQSMEEGSWDGADSLRKMTLEDCLGKVDSCYDYDSLYQLTSEKGVQSHTYQIDSLANRLMKDQSEYQVNALNQLLNQQEVDYSYDTNGNLASRNGLICEYDPLDRLIAVTQGSIREQYEYDSFHRRLKRTRFSQNANTWKEVESERFLYQGNHEIGSVDKEDRIQELRVIGIGQEGEIGSAVLLEFGNKTYVPFHDYRGNVVTLVDLETEAVTECYRYSAYGEEERYDGQGNKLETGINPWRFSSKRVDSFTGWVYFGRRYYDPEVARWTTPDPEFFVDGPNLYSYVRNQPLVCIDPKGTFLFGLLGKIFEGVTIPFYDTPLYGKPTSQSKSSHNGILRGSNQSEGIGYSFINGVFNTKSDVFQSAGMIASINGGNDVRWTWNATHGHFDFVEAVIGREGIATRPVDLLKENWKGYFQNAAEDSIMIHVCHSQGAIHTKNALRTFDKELRSRIYVIAVSPAVYIDKNQCGRVVHLVSKRDFVPFTDPIGFAKNVENVVILSPHSDAPIFDHTIRSPTFTTSIRDYMNKFKNNYGPEK